MQEFLHQTADTGDTQSDSRYRRLSIRHYCTLLGAIFSLLNNLFTLKYTELTCILYLEIESIH